MVNIQEIKKEIEEQRALLQTYLASDMNIDKMDFNEVVNYAIADVNDQNIFLGHWKDYAFLRGKLTQRQNDFKEFEKIRSEIGYYVGKVINRKLNEKELEQLDFFIKNKILNGKLK